MSEATQGGDRHAWESEYANLEDDLLTEPFEALPELLDLVERMLDAAGYEEREPGAVLERDVDVVLERARDVLQRYEAGLPVGNDDALQAAAELRALYTTLLGHREAEAGADLRELDSDLG
jgi:hypothetical protein